MVLPCSSFTGTPLDHEDQLEQEAWKPVEGLQDSFQKKRSQLDKLKNIRRPSEARLKEHRPCPHTLILMGNSTPAPLP